MPLEAEFVQYLATLNSSEAEFNSLPLVERSTIRRNFSQAPGGKRKFEELQQPGIFNRILNFFWTPTQPGNDLHPMNFIVVHHF